MLNKLYHAVTTYPGKTAFHHVKAHQDESAGVGTLPLGGGARANVQVDQLAGDFAATRAVPAAAPRFQHTAAQLVGSCGTIHQNVGGLVCWKAASPALVEYYRTKLGWMAAQVKSVDWQAGNQALKRLY